MLKITTLLIGAAFSFSFAAAGQDNEPTTAAATSEAIDAEAESIEQNTDDEKVADPVDDGKKMRCKMTKVVNSKIPVRICETEEVWDEQERMMREQRQGTLNRNSSCNTVRC